MVTGETKDDSHAGRGEGRLTRPVALLIAARAVNQVGALSLPFLAVLLVQRDGASLSAAGLVLSAFGVAGVPSRLLGARLTRLLGARCTIVAGLWVCAAAQLALAAAPGLGTALVAATLLGLAFEIYEPASQSLIADLTAPAHRPRAFGLFGAALALGGVAGGVVATLVGGVDLRWLFVVDAVSCLLCASVVRVGLPDHRPAPPPDHGGVRPWLDPRLWLMLASGTGFATLYLQLRVGLPLTLLARGVPGARFGLVLATSSLVVVVAQPLLGARLVRGRLADPFRAMAAGYLLVAGGLALTACATSLGGFLIATVVWGLGDALLLGPPFAVVADLAPAGASAAYLAGFGTCWGVAGVVAPELGTTVLDRAGPTTLWLGCAAAALALAAAQPALHRRMR